MNLIVNNRLDCINYVIGCLGLAPVAAEDSYNLDVAQAVAAMDTFSRNLQNNKGRGLWFNREHNRTLSPDPVNGSIALPNNALAVWVYGDYGQFRKMATRGKFLYDTRLYGLDMSKLVNSDGYLKAVIVTQVDYDDLPETAKFAVATAAGFRFAAQSEMDINRLKVLQQQAQDAEWAVEAEDTQQERNNAFRDNPVMQSFVNNNQPYNVNSWQGDPF